MESTNGQVEFQLVRNTYPLDEKLQCYYTIPVSGSCRPEVGDFIGIYKVGWNKVSDLKCKKMIKLNEYNECKEEIGCGLVLFDTHELPKEMKPDSFYQFVYVKKGELIRGASKPFLFEYKQSMTTPVTGSDSIVSENNNDLINFDLCEQKREIRRQIDELEQDKPQRQWKQCEEPESLNSLIDQLRNNEEKICGIQQHFNEMKGLKGLLSKSTIGGSIGGDEKSKPEWNQDLSELQHGLFSLRHGLNALKSKDTNTVWSERVDKIEKRLTEKLTRQMQTRARELSVTESQIENCNQQLVDLEHRLSTTINQPKQSLLRLRQCQTNLRECELKLRECQKDMVEMMPRVRDQVTRFGLINGGDLEFQFLDMYRQAVERQQEKQKKLQRMVDDVEYELSEFKDTQIVDKYERQFQLQRKEQHEQQKQNQPQIRLLEFEIDQQQLKQCLIDLEKAFRELTLTSISTIAGELQDQTELIHVQQKKLQKVVNEVKSFWTFYKQQLFSLKSESNFIYRLESEQIYKRFWSVLCMLESQMLEFHRCLQKVLSAGDKRPLRFEQRENILRRHIHMLQIVKGLKWSVPNDKQQLTVEAVKGMLERFMDKCERLMPVECEVYEPVRRMMPRFGQFIKMLEHFEEQNKTCWDQKTSKMAVKIMHQLFERVKECENIFVDKIYSEKKLELTGGRFYQYIPILMQQIRDMGRYIQICFEITEPQQHHYHHHHHQQQQQQQQFKHQQNYYNQQNQDQLYSSLPYDKFTSEPIMTTSIPVITPFNLTNESVESIIARYNNTCRTNPIEQEYIVSELVQKYIACLHKPDSEFERTFQRLYVESSKLGKSLRARVNEVCQLRRQFDELQKARFNLEGKFVQNNRSEQKRKMSEETIEQAQNTMPKVTITVEHVPADEDRDSEEQERVQEESDEETDGEMDDESYVCINKKKNSEESMIEKMIKDMTSNLKDLYVENVENCCNSLPVRQSEKYKKDFPLLSKDKLNFFDEDLSEYPEYIECPEETLSLRIPRISETSQLTKQEMISQLQKKIAKLVEKSLDKKEINNNNNNNNNMKTIETTESCVCPVCGIALAKNLSQFEYELHVNSHFSD